ncbi:MAG: hypothetical protein GXO90_11215 [FCB group bacterium]|nr:hypothetical protein [FCB group bacterium]
MNKQGTIYLYGFLLWLTVFIGSILIYPVKNTDPIFFETLITIILVGFTVFFANLYLKKIQSDLSKAAVFAGIVWMIINIVIDLFMFSSGPMKMPIGNYFKDIGLTYLVIPMITYGIAVQFRLREKD